MDFWADPAVKVNPEPVIWAALTATLLGVQLSVPGPLSLTTVAVPVALFPVTPAEDATLQLTTVVPLIKMALSDSDPEVVVGALLMVTCRHADIA